MIGIPEEVLGSIRAGIDEGSAVDNSVFRSEGPAARSVGILKTLSQTTISASIWMPKTTQQSIPGLSLTGILASVQFIKFQDMEGMAIKA
jgi:hypothetical protein